MDSRISNASKGYGTFSSPEAVGLGARSVADGDASSSSLSVSSSTIQDITDTSLEDRNIEQGGQDAAYWGLSVIDITEEEPNQDATLQSYLKILHPSRKVELEKIENQIGSKGWMLIGLKRSLLSIADIFLGLRRLIGSLPALIRLYRAYRIHQTGIGKLAELKENLDALSKNFTEFETLSSASLNVENLNNLNRLNDEIKNLTQHTISILEEIDPNLPKDEDKGKEYAEREKYVKQCLSDYTIQSDRVLSIKEQASLLIASYGITILNAVSYLAFLIPFPPAAIGGSLIARLGANGLSTIVGLKTGLNDYELIRRQFAIRQKGHALSPQQNALFDDQNEYLQCVHHQILAKSSWLETGVRFIKSCLTIGLFVGVTTAVALGIAAFSGIFGAAASILLISAAGIIAKSILVIGFCYLGFKMLKAVKNSLQSAYQEHKLISAQTPDEGEKAFKNLLKNNGSFAARYLTDQLLNPDTRQLTRNYLQRFALLNPQEWTAILSTNPDDESSFNQTAQFLGQKMGLTD